jgi:hypothetical protein
MGCRGAENLIRVADNEKKGVLPLPELLAAYVECARTSRLVDEGDKKFLATELQRESAEVARLACMCKYGGLLDKLVTERQVTDAIAKSEGRSTQTCLTKLAATIFVEAEQWQAKQNGTADKLIQELKAQTLSHPEVWLGKLLGLLV